MHFLQVEEDNLALKKITYNSGDYIIEIKIKDGTGKFIENWTIMASDLPKFANIMKMKYGIRFDKVSKELEWAI